jgi:hypothetical protein
MPDGAALEATYRAAFALRASPEVAFDVATDVEDWPLSNPTCRAVEVLARDGFATSFRFVGAGGEVWRSTQYACRAGLFSYTERHDPPAPLASLAFVRRVRAVGGGRAEVVEEVICRLRPGSGDELPLVVARIAAHRGAAEESFRARVEARGRAAPETGGDR